MATHPQHVAAFAEGPEIARYMGERQEVVGRRRDGTEFPAEATIAKLEQQGELILAVILRDITPRKQAEAELQRYILRLEILEEIDRAILAARSPAEIAGVALQPLGSLLPQCRRASVTLFDFEVNQVIWLALSVEGRFRPDAGGSYSIADFGDVEPLSQGCCQRLDDLRARTGRSRLEEQLLAGGMASALHVPLLVSDRLIGSFNLAADRVDAFNDEDIEIARQIADPLAVALQNARLFDQVQAGRERLRQLNRKAITVQEEERQRVSRELHDEAGQALTALKISLELIQSDMPDGLDRLRRQLGEAIAPADRTMEQIRLLAHGLRPPALDAVGLSPTLADFCHAFAQRTYLTITYTGVDLPPLPEDIMITLYRLVQEALTNVARHAHANRVWVTLEEDNRVIILTVEDDGRGFNKSAVAATASQAAGTGLLGMRERLKPLGGHLEIDAHPGRGTRLAAHVPWQILSERGVKDKERSFYDSSDSGR